MTPDKLVRNFARCNDWEQRYLYLIELGECMPRLDKAKQTEHYAMKGCQSQVWIDQSYSEETCTYQFEGHSDAAIVKGLVALAIIAFNNQSARQIVDFKITGWFEQLELTQHLTPTRSQGLLSIVTAIIEKANQRLLSEAHLEPHHRIK